MRHTTFAGLTELSAGEALTVDGSSFTTRNPPVIDQWLSQIPRHHHNAAPPLADPATTPSVTAHASGGALPGNTTVYLGYTLLDAGGGETALGPVISATTPGGIGAPTVAPSGVMDYTAGHLVINTYQYAVTLTDETGGETTPSPPRTLEYVSGHASGQAVISGLNVILAANPLATGWRLYRSTGGSQYALLAIGTGASYTDDGTVAVDFGTLPSSRDTTSQSGSLDFTVPSGALVGATAFAVYVSLTNQFPDPARYGIYPSASGGMPIHINTLAVTTGTPPVVSNAVRGAPKINADTEITNLHWLAAVSTHSALPSGVQGDVRWTLDTGLIYGMESASGAGPSDWTRIGGGSTPTLDYVRVTTLGSGTLFTTNFESSLPWEFIQESRGGGGSMWTAGPGATKVSATTDGVYHIDAYADFGAASGGLTRRLRLFLNGADDLALSSTYPQDVANLAYVSVSTSIIMGPGDYVELLAYQDSGGDLDIYDAAMTVTKVSS